MGTATPDAPEKNRPGETDSDKKVDAEPEETSKSEPDTSPADLNTTDPNALAQHLEGEVVGSGVKRLIESHEIKQPSSSMADAAKQGIPGPEHREEQARRLEAKAPSPDSDPAPIGKPIFFVNWNERRQQAANGKAAELADTLQQAKGTQPPPPAAPAEPKSPPPGAVTPQPSSESYTKEEIAAAQQRKLSTKLAATLQQVKEGQPSTAPAEATPPVPEPAKPATAEQALASAEALIATHHEQQTKELAERRAWIAERAKRRPEPLQESFSAIEARNRGFALQQMHKNLKESHPEAYTAIEGLRALLPSGFEIGVYLPADRANPVAKLPIFAVSSSERKELTHDEFIQMIGQEVFAKRLTQAQYTEIVNRYEMLINTVKKDAAQAVAKPAASVPPPERMTIPELTAQDPAIAETLAPLSQLLASFHFEFGPYQPPTPEHPSATLPLLLVQSGQRTQISREYLFNYLRECVKQKRLDEQQYQQAEHWYADLEDRIRAVAAKQMTEKTGVSYEAQLPATPISEAAPDKPSASEPVVPPTAPAIPDALPTQTAAPSPEQQTPSDATLQQIRALSQRLEAPVPGLRIADPEKDDKTGSGHIRFYKKNQAGKEEEIDDYAAAVRNTPLDPDTQKQLIDEYKKFPELVTPLVQQYFTQLQAEKGGPAPAATPAEAPKQSGGILNRIGRIIGFGRRK